MLSRKDRARLRALAKGKQRADAGLFLVTGVRAVGEVLASAAPGAVSLVVVSPRLSNVPGGNALASHLSAIARVEHVTDEELSTVAPTLSHQGIVAVCALPGLEISSIPGASTRRVLVLDGIQDPGNVGTLIRAAVAFGSTLVVCLDGSADPYGPKAVRSAAGMVLRVPVLRTDGDTFLDWASQRGAALWVADAGGEPVGAGPPPKGPWCLVLGAEGHGVRHSIREAAARVVRVHMSGPAESLNVAMAGSILLHALGPLPGSNPGDEDNR